MAIACKRALKVDGVIISRTMAYLVKGKKAIRFMLPTSVGREITSFDRGSGFDPGIYRLSKPGHGLGTQKYRGPHETKTKRKMTFRHYTGRIRTTLGGKDAAA